MRRGKECREDNQGTVNKTLSHIFSCCCSQGQQGQRSHSGNKGQGCLQVQELQLGLKEEDAEAALSYQPLSFSQLRDELGRFGPVHPESGRLQQVNRKGRALLVQPLYLRIHFVFPTPS